MDPCVERMAYVLVHYSNQIRKGDRVFIEAEPPAEPLIRALYRQILEAGGYPHLSLSLSGLTYKSNFDDVFLTYAVEEQLDYVPPFYKIAYDSFEARIRIWSQSNTKALSQADRGKMARRERAVEPITAAQFTRGDRGDFRWVTTLYPTEAYAQDAEMSLREFSDLVFSACHVDDPQSDPLAYWQSVEVEQDRIVGTLNGHDRVIVRGPNCDLTLSIRGRTFINACGRNNMPDGEVFTGPVEDSVDGWVRFNVPSVFHGNEVSGVELKFVDGRVEDAKAAKNQSFLSEMLATDSGARFLGEFAVGTNFGIRRATRNILFDEKIGGTIHMALGAGYPKTGSENKSAIHWDLITEMQDGGEILVDGELVYKDGRFTI